MTDKKIILKTIKDVEIMETGQFACASGTHDFSSDDLASAVAALDDPAIHEPRLKLGHVGEQGSMLGMPVFGKFVNMHLEAEGNKLVGDIVGVPDWLEEIMPTAYPARSIEGRWAYTSATNKEHQFVILAVSLLGVELPGIATLEDLQTLYANGPEELLVEAAGPVVATYGQEVHIMAGKAKAAPKKATAAVDPNDVRKSFYNDFATEGEGRYWWWAHELFIDPTEIIAEDEETGKLYRVPYSISGDAVTFGEPAEVKKTYVDAGAATASGAATAALTYTTRAESRIDTTEENGMKLTDEQAKTLRVTLGLPEDATEEQIAAKLGETPAVPPTTDDDAGTVTPEIQQPAPVASGDVVQLDRATYEGLTRGAQAGEAARAEQVKSKRDRIIADAAESGKIPPARAPHWRALLDADEEGTAATLASLQPGLIPVAERGTAKSDAADVNADASAYPSWLVPAGTAGTES